MRLTSRGRLGLNTTTPTELLDVNGNINCGGGIAITGSTAFFGGDNVNTENKINTYINFKYAVI
jgi:hypothetical protein